MTFPTTIDYNAGLDLLLNLLTAAAKALNAFMTTTEPYVIICAKKKLVFFLLLETTIAFSFLYEARRAKYLAWTYLVLKIIALSAPVPSLSGDWLFAAWTVIFAAAFVDFLIINFAIVCLALGNEKGRRIWMRVTPKRKMLESFALVVYNSTKVLLLTNNLCRRWVVESNVWEGADYFWRLPPHNMREYYLQKRLQAMFPVFDYTRTRYRSRVTDFFKADSDSYIWQELINGYHQAGIWPDFAYFNTVAELDSVSNLRYGILFILALSSLTVYSIILAGWSSNSKYAFLGALRSAAQMISYEVSISLALLPVILLSGSLNLTEIVFAQANTLWYIFPLLPIALIFLVSMLAETNRTPFDLPEAEAELVAGYNVDYSSLPFAMFFLGEYANMILISVFFCILFLGGWEFMGLTGFAPFVLAFKAAAPWIFFVLVRATLPRYRYDQLMDIGWKAFLPLTGAFLVLVIGLVVFLDVAPVVEELPF